MSVALKHYEQGHPDAPVVFLGPALGTRLATWDHLAASLEDAFRVVRFDTRGHGGSPASPEGAGPLTVDELASDVLALADELEVERFGYVGISLGGAVGQTLALDHGDRLTTLVLCSTSPRFGDPASWRERAARVRADGMAWLGDPTRERWFTPSFRTASPDVVDAAIRDLVSTATEGYAACCDALAGFDVTDRLGQITVPTRVVAGGADPTCPPDVTRALAAAVPGADLVMLDGVAHLAHLAAPEAFDAAVLEHLTR